MTNLKKLILIFTAVLLVSLACNTITGQGGNSQPQVDIVSDDDVAIEVPEAVEDPDPAANNNDQPAEDPAPADQPAANVDANGTITAVGDAKGVEVIEMNWEQFSDGSILFVGLLQNNSENELSFINLNFTLRDADNTPVVTGNAYSSLDILSPGDTSPFQIAFYDPPYDPWTTYEILIDADVNEYFTHYTDFEVVSAELQEDDFGYQIVGEIRNTGEQSSDFVAVYALIYSSSGELISTDFTFTEADSVAPGETDTYSIYIWETFGDQVPDHFTLFVEGNLVSE